MVEINETVDIHGSDYQIVITKSGIEKSPLFIYVNKVADFPSFGGYVYSIKDPKGIIYQVTIKAGGCEEQCKSLGNLMGKKYVFPNYCNLNNVEPMDFKVLLMKLNELMRDI